MSRGSSIENRSRFTDSLVNVFDSRKKSDLDSVTTDSFNMQSLNDTIEEENLQKNKDNIILNMSKEEFLESIFGPSLHLNDQNVSIKEKIRKVLLSNYLHVAIVVLVILDSLCVTIELIIEAENKNNSHALHVAEEVFKYLGFGILCIFMVEIALKIIFVFNEFRHSKLEILDAIVVVISFIAEIVVLKHDDAISAIVGLIAIFRFWRIIRIVNGFTMTVERRYEGKIDKLKQGMNALIKEIENLKEELSKKEDLLKDV
ncbi:voltage-gated hydrogen channel 1 [Brachionus plicatilis]|uniref:Voltage-gated hydrogen channel 1 n=1 Tax=Brachionus plicatilis TaxID=10195 RepID=A0A3M7QN12_BRAPC|nr:voltage-gated hydrogen channel 1 [Brachionus plicatilis]